MDRPAQETTETSHISDEQLQQTPSEKTGIEFPRFFTLRGVDPFDEITWEQRAAVIGNERGEVVFEQRDVEIPSFWSQQATNIVVSKYFRGHRHAGAREERQAVDWPRGGYDHRLGAEGWLLRHGRGPARVQR